MTTSAQATWHFDEPESIVAEYILSLTESGSPAAERSVGLQQMLRVDSAALASAPALNTLSVRARNAATGLSEAASATLKLVGAPVGGTVSFDAVGGFLNNGSALSGTWSGFEQVGATLAFEACAGTTALGCQLTAFAPASGGKWRWESGLPCGVTYYLAVRATNCAGLQRTVASAGAKLCCSGPSGGAVSMVDASGAAVSFATNATALRVRWSGFVEPCSGVREYGVSLVAVATGATLWSASVLASAEPEAELPPSLVSGLSHGAVYEARVVATSSAGLSGHATTSLTVDLTPPVSVGVELDWPGRADQVANNGLSAAACLPPSAAHVQLRWLGAADPESAPLAFSLARTADASLGAPAAWEALFSCAGYRCTTTTGACSFAGIGATEADAAIRVCAAESNLGGRGPCVGVSPYKEPVGNNSCGAGGATSWVGCLAIEPSGSGTACEVLPSSTSTFRLDATSTLAQDASTSFQVRACNPAGLCSTSDWSRGAARVAAPSGGVVSVLPSAGASLGYLGGQSLLTGEWSGFDAGSSLSALSFEACVGTTTRGCQTAPFAPASAGEVWRADSLTLPCGVTYYLAVRATNCAGLQRTVASAGAKLCCSGPSGGAVSMVDASGAAVSFATNATALRVRWSGFVEPCSGVREYGVSLVAVATGATLWSASVLASAEPEAAVPAAVVSALEHGAAYRVVVAATSNAGLAGEAEARVTVDLTPPVTGVLVDGLGALDLSCAATSEPLTCAWDRASDDVSGLRSVEWALGTAPLGEDVQPFASLPVTSSSAQAATVPAALGLLAGATVYCTVRSTNRVGLASVITSDGAKLVDAAACTEPFHCLPGPLGLMLAPIAALPSRGAATAHEHEYQIEARTMLPRHGLFLFHTRVRLMELERDDESGERVMKLVVDENHMTDSHGARHPLQGEDDMRRHPFYFRRSASGEVVGVMHHREEEKRVLGSKRFLASAHQLPVADAPPHASVWSAVEDDAVGRSSGTYSVRGCHIA